jgi:hypothetical protein
MLKKLSAFAVLALALSPFTAPFRTCDSHQISSTPFIGENDPGPLVASLATETGRLKIAPTAGVVAVSHCSEPPLTFGTRSKAPARGVSERRIFSTILRV